MKGSIVVIIIIYNNETNFAFSNENTCNTNQKLTTLIYHIVKCNVLRNIIFLKQDHFNVKM